MARFPVILAAAFCASLAAQDLSQKGAEAMRAGRYAEAETVYRQLIKQQPNEAGWHANLGLALHSQGKFQEAVVPLKRGLTMRFSAGLAAVLGVDYLKIGKPCEAIEPLARADQPEALADAYMGCGRFPQAARSFEKLGQSRLAAQAFWKARDYASAKPLYALLEPQHAADPDFQYEYGDSLLRSDGAEAALPHLERAKNLIPARGALGKAYAELGRYEEAIPHLEAAVPIDPDLLLPLSRAYKATGRAAEAERALKSYRERVSAQN